jgi:hypothetical protein
MPTNEIYNRQFAILIFFAAMTFKLSNLPTFLSTSVGVNMLAAVMITVIEIVLYVLVALFIRSGGFDSLDYAYKPAQYPLMIIISLFLALKATLFFSGAAYNVKGLMFDQASNELIFLTLIIPIAFMAVKGIRVIARTAEIFFPLVVFLMVFSIAFIKGNMNINYNLPLLTMPIADYTKFTLGYGLWMVDALPFLFLSLKNHKLPYTSLGIAFSYFAVLACIFLGNALYGNFMVKIGNLFIKVNAFNYFAEELGNLQWMGILAWLTMTAIYLSTLYWGSIEALTRVIKKRNLAAAIILVGSLISVLVVKEILIRSFIITPIFGYVMLGAGSACIILALSLLGLKKHKISQKGGSGDERKDNAKDAKDIGGLKKADL